LVTQAAATIRHPVLRVCQPPVALVDSLHAFVELALAREDARRFSFALRQLALALGQLRDGGREPRASLLELRRSSRRRGLRELERSLPAHELVRPCLEVAHLARPMGKPRLLDRELRRAAVQLLLRRGASRVPNLEVALALGEIAFAATRRLDLRGQLALRPLDSLTPQLELAAELLERRRAAIELRANRGVDPRTRFRLRELQLQPLAATLEVAHLPFLLLERGLGRSQPIAALVELRRQRPGRPLAFLELAFAFAESGEALLRLERSGLARLQVLDPPLTFVQPRLRVLQHPLPLVELGRQRLDACRTLVELDRAPADSLVQSPLAFGERRPRFAQVGLFEHSWSFAAREDIAKSERQTASLRLQSRLLGHEGAADCGSRAAPHSCFVGPRIRP